MSEKEKKLTKDVNASFGDLGIFHIKLKHRSGKNISKKFRLTLICRFHDTSKKLNVYKELYQDLQIPPSSNGCLLPWASQGVLLLNATLTVKRSTPMSHHGRGWEKFTDAVLKKLANQQAPLVFVLWGKSAQEKCRFLYENKAHPHLVLTAAHPSPYSAQNGFFGCRHFSKINQFLTENGVSPIDWQLSS